MGSLARKAAVVGVHEFPGRVIPGYTEPRLEAEAAGVAPGRGDGGGAPQRRLSGLRQDSGGLSSNQPGARGLFLVIEATRQLRGNEGKRQVKDCKIALCHGTGFSLGTQHGGVTIILAED